MRLAQLEAIMKEKNITRVQLAKQLNITYGALSKRLIGYIDLNLSEVRAIAKILDLTDEETMRCFYLN